MYISFLFIPENIPFDPETDAKDQKVLDNILRRMLDRKHANTNVPIYSVKMTDGDRQVFAKHYDKESNEHGLVLLFKGKHSEYIEFLNKKAAAAYRNLQSGVINFETMKKIQLPDESGRSDAEERSIYIEPCAIWGDVSYALSSEQQEVLEKKRRSDHKCPSWGGKNSNS